MIKVGDTYSMTVTITADMVATYGAVTGDMNPIHFDEDYARETRFGKNIVHGMLLLGYFSNIVGNHLPGNGTIYNMQTARFARPVFIDDTLTFTVTVTEIDKEKSKIILSNTCVNANGEMVLEGEAKVYNYTPGLLEHA